METLLSAFPSSRSVPGHPGTVLTLTEGQRLVLWALRRSARPGDDAGAVERELARLLGPERGRLAHVALRCLLVLLALYGRRRLRLGADGWLDLTSDEVRVLQTLGAAQTGHGAALDAHLDWLIRSEAAGRPAEACRAIAGALAGAHMALPLVVRQAPRVADGDATTCCLCPVCPLRGD